MPGRGRANENMGPAVQHQPLQAEEEQKRNGFTMKQFNELLAENARLEKELAEMDQRIRKQEEEISKYRKHDPLINALNALVESEVATIEKELVEVHQMETRSIRRDIEELKKEKKRLLNNVNTLVKLSKDME